MEEWIQTYGYLAVMLCACFEGEIGVIIAGSLCGRGLLDPYKVTTVAFLSTMIWELCIFLIGRKWGKFFINKYPRIQKTASQAFEFLQKYDILFIFSFRFIYGIRNVSPLVIGASAVPAIKYAICNLIAAAIWAVLFVSIGYIFSEGIGAVIDSIMNNFNYISKGALIFFLILGSIFVIRNNMKRK